MELHKTCFFCGFGGAVLKLKFDQDWNEKWMKNCVASICCLFQIPTDHDTLPDLLSSAHYCDKCRQLVRDVDFTLRLFAQLLQRLEHLQNEILDKLSHKKDDDDEMTHDDDKNFMTDLFREGSANINVGLEQLKMVLNLERLTTKRSSKSESSPYFDVPPKTLRGLKRKVKHSEDHAHESEVTFEVKLETEDDKFDVEPEWTMDPDDEDNSSREDDLSDPEISRDSSNDEEEISGKIVKPRRKRIRRPPLTKMGFKCPLCKLRYASQLALDCHHRKIHEEDPVPFHCDNCPKKFAVYKTFTRHKASNCGTLPSRRSAHPSSNTFLCEFCSKKYATAASLENHVACSHSQKHCELCNFGFDTAQEVELHEQLHHNSDQPFKCVLCSEILTNSSNLKKHVVSSHTDKKIACPTCGIMLNSNRAMQRHEKTHAEDYVGHRCTVCGYTFNNAAALKFHSFKHSETKQFTCEICRKGFTYQTSLKIHLASHSSEAKFVCKICGKGFSHKPFLMRHEEIHSGTINYECSTCGKKFKTKNSLKQHVATHAPKNASRKPRKRKIQDFGNLDEDRDDDQDGNHTPQIIYV